MGGLMHSQVPLHHSPEAALVAVLTAIIPIAHGCRLLMLGCIVFPLHTAVQTLKLTDGGC